MQNSQTIINFAYRGRILQTKVKKNHLISLSFYILFVNTRKKSKESEEAAEKRKP